MALSIKKVKLSGQMVKPGKRLFLTAKKDRLVEPGDAKAAFLYCAEGDEVPKEEFEALAKASKIKGLKSSSSGGKKGSKKSPNKSKEPSEDK